MSNIFAEYATSTASSVTLSKVQCNALLSLEDFDEKRKENPLYVSLHNMSTLRCLEDRGLVEWNYVGSRANGFKGLTEAGKVMVQLLKLAGMTVENTKTASVRRREGLRAA